MCVLYGVAYGRHTLSCREQLDQKSAPFGLELPNSKEILLLRVMLDQKKRSEGRIANGAAVITRQDYPALVELNIAGRSDGEIARRFDSSLRQVRMHISQAMAMYRRGDLLIDSGAAVLEAREKGAQVASSTYQDVSTPIQPVSLISVSA